MENASISARLLTKRNGAAGKASLGDAAAAMSLQTELPINRALLGLMIFLGTEVMFFAGLISALLILRAGSGVWPPPGQPRLPVAVTALNTLFLLLSAYTMHRAVQAIRRSNPKTSVNWLAVTGALGTIFLAVQGTEWFRLVQFGLTLTSSLYGATFYVLIGCHGLHVLAAVIVLLVVLGRATRERYSAQNHTGLELCRLYWFFVVGIWPVLYVLVYLS